MKYLTDQEVSSFIGVSADDVLRTICDGIEAFLVKESGLTIVKSRTKTFQGPLEKINLGIQYLSSIDSIILDGIILNTDEFTVNLKDGIINLELEIGSEAVVTFTPTLDKSQHVYIPSTYFEIPDYPVKYIVEVRNGYGELVDNFELIEEQVIKLPDIGTYDIEYRAGMKIPAELKLAILLTIKYWYKINSENLIGVRSYKIGDEAVSFFETSNIPTEAKLLLDRISRKQFVYFGKIV